MLDPLANTPAERAVAAMFANQTSWLEKLTPTQVLRRHPQTGDEIVFASNSCLGISCPSAPDIDDTLTWLETHASGDLLIWSARPNVEADLTLHARGARASFLPLWMHRSLDSALPPVIPASDMVIAQATASDFDALVAAHDVPYTRTPQLGRLFHLATDPATRNDVMMLLARRRPRRLVSPSPGAIVGVGILHLTGSEPNRHGAIFNLGVDPRWRNRGIGAALTQSLCHLAHEMGATEMALNSTPQGESMYRSQGFVAAGEGQTWFVGQAALLHRPPGPEVANAEALGRGELARLDPQVAHWKTLPNGDTPIAFAARFNQATAIAWLLDRSATPDIVPLWEMGFQDEAIAAMQNGQWLNAQRSPELTTPLHEAIHLNDEPLVRLLLDANPDLELRDCQWNGRPIEWTRALGHSHLTTLIEAAS